MHPEILAHVVRDGVVECEHYGVAAAVREMKLVESAGSPKDEFYYRSSLKPFQAIPFVESGAIERFGLDESHVAIVSGSIDANERQVAMVRDMLSRGGLTEDHLQCPPDLPGDEAEASPIHVDAVRRGLKKSRIFHNCAAKHAGMLLASLMYGAPPERYLERDHPVQKRIAEVMKTVLKHPREVIGLDPEHWHYGGDGCGAPCLSASVFEMAASFSSLVKPGNDIPPDLAKHLTRIARAMAKYPELIGGDERHIDTDIMRFAKGGLVAKGGAEGLLCVARFSDGLSLAIRSVDGQRRGMRPAAIAWLKMLGMLPQDTGKTFYYYESKPVKSRGDRIVGAITYCGKTFQLKT
ncbi:MAG: asparaginase [Planctomycetes bacterium]|nr:asparaginase [Planctomycetota bacterium]NUQ35951.1 asparaginase [Planctomycetaceae bacterium]